MLAAVLSSVCVTTIAHADSSPAAAASVPAPAAPQEDVDVQAALRAARLDLLALVAKEAAEAEREQPQSTAAPIVMGTPPTSMSSSAPRLPHVQPGSSPSLDWLQGLSLPDIPVRWDDRLVRMLEYYRSDPRGRAIVRSLLARQGVYGPMIRAKLKTAHLPQDLIYVAMVESGFDPRARSDAGAAGMWQLMAAPATEYALEMSRWVDQRFNPEPATDAALQYLHDAYQQLGSWPLALAAFNMGFGALTRSIQKYNTNDFWLLASLEAGLPYETVVYVTKVMAYAIIGHNPDRFGFADVVPDRPLEVTSFELPGGMSLRRIARAAGVDVDTLSALNPELKKARLPPDVKTWNVRIPKARAERFRQRFHRYAKLLPAHRVHRLRLGERLSDVAELYGTTPAKLLKLNDLTDATRPRPGQRLLVPDVEPVVRTQTDKPTVGIPGDTFTYANRRRVFYRVADGDELTEIARFFRVTPQELQLWNHIATDAKLQRGMYLQLYVPPRVDLSQAVVLAPNQVRTLVVGSEEFFDFHERQQNRVRVRYRVQPGDTLRSLAQRFDVSVGSLARINQFSRGKKLEPDSEIIVYVAEDAAKRASK